MNEKLNFEEIYNLFKTHSSKANKEISKKINTFKKNIDFFEHYANKDIKNLFNIFELKLPENNDNYFLLSFKSDTERYMSCVSQIILSIKIFLKIQDILTKIVTNAKSYLSKLKCESKLKNYNQNYLFLYLESLLKTYKKNHTFFPSDSTLFSSKMSSIEDNLKNYSSPKFLGKHKTGISSNNETKSIFYNKLPTPRFKSKPKEKFENKEQKNPNLENSTTNIFLIKKNSVFTLAEYIYDEEKFTPKKNLEGNLINSRINLQNKTKTYTKVRKPKTESVNKLKNITQILSETDFMIENNKENYCKNLLEMINNIYRKGIINSEEKVKLKQLVIEKSRKIEYLYNNIYKNSQNDKNKLIYEVKKILN